MRGAAQVGIEDEIPLVGSYFVQELSIDPDRGVVHQDVATFMFPGDYFTSLGYDRGIH